MDTKRLRELLDQMDDVKKQIQEVTGGAAGETKPRKTLSCSICGGEHTARVCPEKPKSNGAPPPDDAPPPLT